ncbi:MAG: alpha/beta hydrolase [Planctomycetota bacterium]
MKWLFAAVLVICLPCSVLAQESAMPDVAENEKPVLAVWPDGFLPPDARPVSDDRIAELKEQETEERVTYVERATLTVYEAPAETSNGCSVIVCPGGGYGILAWSKEGLELAEWFNSIGVTAFVLKYRVPRRDPERIHHEPLQDLQRAIRLIRSNAPQWNIDPDRIGVLGFSAGGHLTLMSGFHFDQNSYEPIDEIDQASSRPDYLCPIYAAYLGNDYRDDTAELGDLVNVTPRTPPTFMAVTADDKMRGAQAALLMARLIENEVPAELHVYSKGGHGYGIRPGANPVSSWHHRLEEWMRASGLLDKTEGG